MKYRRFRPYADFLVGVGTITYPNYVVGQIVNDSGFTYSTGAGLEYALVKNFALRADYHF